MNDDARLFKQPSQCESDSSSSCSEVQSTRLVFLLEKLILSLNNPKYQISINFKDLKLEFSSFLPNSVSNKYFNSKTFES